ncbi:23S rRNA (adenine(2503)-C(2))-methyltransferase RlmN [Bdellovibrionota bacterium FG-2]
MIYFQSLTQAELSDLLLPLSLERLGRRTEPSEAPSEALMTKAKKQSRFHAQQIFHWVYQRGVSQWALMSDLSKDHRAWLTANLEVYRPKVASRQESPDGTIKFLWEMGDGKTIESVIIPAAEGERFTGCISSQIGCAMKCAFCLTGTQGVERNLEVHEILAQVYELRQVAPLTNVVFMGMGEPLKNLDNVVKACQIMLDTDGLNFSKRKVTVSTSGLVPGIAELGARVDVSLAVSLNATTDEQRSAIMPVNRKWNIAELLKACRAYPLSSHRRITFEYVILRDFNDSLEDARRLMKLLVGIPSKINLIPFNEHPSADFKRPSDATVRGFQKFLVDGRMTATVRVSRGREISAACGQLRSAVLDC